MEAEKKVYTALQDFTLNGESFVKGEKYELDVQAVGTLAEGTVEEFVAPTQDGAATPGAGEAGEGETTPAKPWVGGHTVGKE